MSLVSRAVCPTGFIPSPSGMNCQGKGQCCISSAVTDCCDDCARNRCERVGGKWTPLYAKKRAVEKSSCKTLSTCLIGKNIFTLIYIEHRQWFFDFSV